MTGKISRKGEKGRCKAKASCQNKYDNHKGPPESGNIGKKFARKGVASIKIHRGQQVPDGLSPVGNNFLYSILALELAMVPC